MRGLYLFAVVGLVLALCGTAHAACSNTSVGGGFTCVQGGTKSNGATSSTTCAVTLGSAVGAGHALLIAGGIANDPTDVVTSVTDNASGNTYVVLDTNGTDTTDNYNWGTAYGINIQSSPTIITLHFARTQTFANCTVDEYSGVATASALDASSAINLQLSPAAGANTVTTAAICATGCSNGDLIWGATVDARGNGTISAGTSPNAFNQRESVASVLMTEDFAQTSAASISTTFGASVGTDSFMTGAVALKAASGGGTPGCKNGRMLMGAGC